MDIRNTDKKQKFVFPVFWKLALFITVVFAASISAVSFSMYTILAPSALRGAEDVCVTKNQNAAIALNTILGGVKNNVQYFINAFSLMEDSGERNSFTYTFFRNNPEISAIVTHPKNAGIYSAEKIINIDLLNKKVLDFNSVDLFLKSYESQLAAAAVSGGGIFNAYPVFGKPVLVYALPDGPESRSYFFFLAENLSTFLKIPVEDGTAFLVNKNTGVLIHSDIVLTRSAVRLEEAGYVREIALSAEEEGALVVDGKDGGEYFVSFRKIEGDAVLIHEFPINSALKEINETLIRNICLGFALLFITLFFTRILTKPFLFRLNRLRKVAEECAAFNFETEIKAGKTDELDKLASALASFQKSARAFSLFTDSRIVSAFLNKELNETLVKKNGVILYANIFNLPDIKKKTNMAELNAYIAEFIGVVDSNTVKTMGVSGRFYDGMICCHWGCAFSTGNRSHDSLNAVRAALMMRIAIIDFNREQKKNGKPPLQAVFALDAGVVSAGITGVQNRREYAVFGNAVKNAKNISVLNRFNGADIVISERIFLRVYNYIIAEELRDFDAGKDKRFFALINLKIKEGVTQAIPRNLVELRKLLEQDDEDTGGGA
ncbi:MAG: hypothetical protein LBC53_01695 [Spirochaetaceae bacterium]|jgi:adenylate cyclase|nr:hypothetical protein [Spirochaetaceae bacterium]